MKKLLAILVLGLLWCNVGFAKLDHKDGKDNFVYNLMVDDYNKYLEEQWDVASFCEGVVPKSLEYLTKLTDCWYKEQRRHLRNNNFLSNHEIVEHLNHTYQLTFNATKVWSLANIKFRGNDTAMASYTREYKEKIDNIFDNYYTRLEEIFIKVAEKENLDFNIGKDSEPKGLDIDDDEIISASSGSGFFVSKEGHIVTNFHVIENCNVVKVHFKGKEIDAEIFAIDKINDLAIVQTNINPLNVFPVSNKDVVLLQDVIVAGYPLGKNVSSAIKMHKGSITALAGYEDNYSNFQTDATINQGNSGGPIIDKYGNVVGVAVATWVEEGVQGIHFGIKSSVLRTFANAKELNFSSPNNREIPKEKLGELISEATTYLECWMTGAKIKKMIAEADTKKALFSKFKQ